MAKKKSRTSQRQTWLRIRGILGILLILTGFVVGSCNSTKSLPDNISVTEAHQKYQEGAFLLDVRTQEEWDAVHIPDTTLIPLDELPARVNEVPTDQEVVVICNSGNRSLVGRDLLRDAGHKLVTSSVGGIQSWAGMNYPLEMGP